MKFKVDSSELVRAVRMLGGVFDPKHNAYANIEISGTEKGLTLRATSGAIFAKTMIPMMGMEEETFCVDGQMFSNIVRGCSGTVEISTDGNVCAVKSTGRTRIPMLSIRLPDPEEINGDAVTVGAEDLIRAEGNIRHAIATDESRLILTGALMERLTGKMRMVALDGFSLSVEEIDADGAERFFAPKMVRMEDGTEHVTASGEKIVVPGAALRKVCDNVSPNDMVRIVSDGNRARFETDYAEVVCVLLRGDYVDYRRIVPETFQTSVRVRTADMKSVIRSSLVAMGKSNLVKFQIGENEIGVASNSESADFDASVPCETQGNGLRIAFDVRFITGALNTIDTEYAVMNFNGPTSPEVTKPDGESGSVRLTLPVRVQ